VWIISSINLFFFDYLFESSHTLAIEISVTPRSHNWLRAVIDCAETVFALSLTARRLTPRSQWLRGDWLRAVNDCGEIDSPQSMTAVIDPRSQPMQHMKSTPRSHWLRGDWLRAVNDCGEIDSPQSMTARRPTTRRHWLRGVDYDYEYLDKFEFSYKTILTQYSVTNTELIEEKKKGSKNLVALSL
jgi:ribosome modulation factor